MVQLSSGDGGDEAEVVLCYPPGAPLGASGVTRGAAEFISSAQDTAGEAAPSFPSLAQMRAASASGSRFYYDQPNGLLFLRVRQAGAWGPAGPDFAAGYCPPCGCALMVAHVAATATAPAAAACEARLAGVAGAAPADVATDPFLSATLPPPKFDLPSTCPALPTFGCDCWGYTGCANRECTAAERATCDARLDGSTAPTPSPSPPPPATASPSPPPPTAASPR